MAIFLTLCYEDVLTYGGSWATLKTIFIAILKTLLETNRHSCPTHWIGEILMTKY